MESILRAVSVYITLLLLFRIAGKRTLAQITTFDLVLTLIISEALQEALVDTDNSLTNAFILIVTLIGLDILLSVVKQHVPSLARVMDGCPVVVVRDGKLEGHAMEMERVDQDEVLTAARDAHGLARFDQIRHAVVEENGHITVVPKKQD